MTSFQKKIFAGSLAALTMVGAVGVSTAPASARDGGAIAAGVIGGLALGAIAGSAASNSGYGYGAPAYGYAPPPPQPVYGGGCYFTRQPVYDEYGEVIGRRRVRVCD
ncbi:hypothetical protein [Lichenihabitans psoromatis]|uniref:hypothetical protein n=1 Tax=Lichenihabitans psoromatis TaxID=2528642 RepID=UPI001FE09FC0|nr:hypothetical protein [Lichenihabitans psoromatis]